LFDALFKEKPRAPLPRLESNDFTPILWDDHYCQVEIVPTENREFVFQQFSKINASTENGLDGFGFADAVERASFPLPTLDKKLSTEFLAKFLADHKLSEAKKVRTGPNTLLTPVLLKRKHSAPPVSLYSLTIRENL